MLVVSEIFHEKSVSKTISLPVWMWDRLDQIAQKRGGNRSSFPQEVLQQALDSAAPLPELTKGSALPADVVAQIGRGVLRAYDLPDFLEALEGEDQPKLLTEWLEDIVARHRQADGPATVEEIPGTGLKVSANLNPPKPSPHTRPPTTQERRRRGGA
jgi:hypothetical protein